MSVRLVEFSNNSSGISNQSQDNSKSIDELVRNKQFKLTNESSEEHGLAVAPNEMVAVEYDLTQNTPSIFIRPDNDLALSSQDLQKFKQDLSSAEKLAVEISNSFKN